jgi:transcriptional regulator with XRE-family HTH domain
MATTRRRAPAKAPAKRRKMADPSDAVVIAPAKPVAARDGLASVAKDLRAWADFVLGAANTAADLSFRVAAARLTKPSHKAAVEKAGSLFRELREGAGFTLGELGRAIDLKDPSLLQAAEGGKVGLPFEVILRLAGVLGRNDPVSTALKLTRSYNPKLWATLESLGLGKLAVQAGREREFANIYRASDAARELSDAEFAAVLQLVRATLDAALAFRAERVEPGEHHTSTRSPTPPSRPD